MASCFSESKLLQLLFFRAEASFQKICTYEMALVQSHSQKRQSRLSAIKVLSLGKINKKCSKCKIQGSIHCCRECSNSCHTFFPPVLEVKMSTVYRRGLQILADLFICEVFGWELPLMSTAQFHMACQEMANAHKTWFLRSCYHLGILWLVKLHNS